MLLTTKYPECLVEYRPVIGMSGLVLGIEVVGDLKADKVLGGIEYRVDIERARRAGCKTDMQKCEFLMGRRKESQDSRAI